MPAKKTESKEKATKTVTKSSTKVSKSTAKKASSNKKRTAKESNKKAVSPRATTKKAITKKSTTKSTSKKSAVKATATKKAASKKSTAKSTATKVAKKSVTKSTTSKKTTTKKTATKKTTTTRKPRAKKLTKEFDIAEYYDLPEKYAKTIVKILAQTPDTLFIYWDISDADRKQYVEKYGEYFFYDTKPVLIVTNKTMNYTFEVDINDYANCWYLHVNDSKCEYTVELGRRPINHYANIPNNYLYVSSSNTIDAPNDHILLEKEQKMVYFKNVKTNTISARPVTRLSFLRNLGKFFNIYEFYKSAYKDEDFSDSTKIMGNSSSVFK